MLLTGAAWHLVRGGPVEAPRQAATVTPGFAFRSDPALVPSAPAAVLREATEDELNFASATHHATRGAWWIELTVHPWSEALRYGTVRPGWLTVPGCGLVEGCLSPGGVRASWIR